MTEYERGYREAIDIVKEKLSEEIDESKNEIRKKTLIDFRSLVIELYEC